MNCKHPGEPYGPNNPPRLRTPGESVEDYRIAMGWDRPKVSAAPRVEHRRGLPVGWNSAALIAKDRAPTSDVKVNVVALLKVDALVQALVAENLRLAKEAYTWWEAAGVQGTNTKCGPSAPPPAGAASFNEGWKEAAVAWEVCASIHREYANGKDGVFKTRQADFVRDAEAARQKALAGDAHQVGDDAASTEQIEARDAARYRWWRAMWLADPEGPHGCIPADVMTAETPEEFDAAVDAEIAKDQT